MAHMATAICLSAPLEFNKILDNPNFADICCRLEIIIFLCFIIQMIQLRQEPARVKYVNPKYISNFSIYTGRKARGMPYFTNMTLNLLLPWVNNVTATTSFKDLKTKNTLNLSYKVCDAMDVPWVKKYIASILNVPAKCPFQAVTYYMTNIAVPEDLPFQLMSNDYEVEFLLFLTRTKEKLIYASVVLRNERVPK